MRKIWVVARREFVERVRTRWFLVSTILGPVVLVLFVLGPLLRQGSEGGGVVVAVVGPEGSPATERIERVLREDPNVWATGGGGDVDSLLALTRANVLDGVVVVGGDMAGDGRVVVYGRRLSVEALVDVVGPAVQRVATELRLTEMGVSAEVVTGAIEAVEIETVEVAAGGPDGLATLVLAMVVWFVLYMAILMYGVNVMGSVIEEKASRVVEILLTSLHPFQLLAGKIGGVGAVGLFQLGIWATFAVLLRAALGMGADGDGTTIGFPAVGLGTGVVFLTYFVLGYLLYAAMFAAVAAASTSEAEARQAQTPVVLLLVAPSALFVSMISDPSGPLAVALSWIPFTSPVSVPVRWAVGAASGVEVAGSLLLLMATLIGVTWLAARIYRVGILVYGKRAGPRELLKWIRLNP